MPANDPAPNPNPAPPAPDNSALIAATLDANTRASRAEARAALAEDAARRAVAVASAATAPKVVDPLDRLATEDVTLAPEQRRALLGQAIEGRARAIAGKALEQARIEDSRREVAMEGRLALDRVAESRPEINTPDGASDFAAAMTKAKFELEAAGVQYTPSQLTSRAAQVYDKTFRKVEKPPVTEGGAQPNLGGFQLPPGAVSGPTQLEKTYGMKPGQIQELVDPNDPVAVMKMTNDYVQSRNKPLFDKGMTTSMQEIIKGGELA